MWEPDSKEPSGHHAAQPHRARQQGAIRPPCGTRPHQAVQSLNSGACSNHRGPVYEHMLVCVCESGLRSEYGSWNPEDIYREKKQEWHTHLLNFNEEAMLFDRLMTTYLKEASIPVTTKSLSPLLVKPISEWTTSPATNSAEKKKKKKPRLNSLLKQFTQIWFKTAIIEQRGKKFTIQAIYTNLVYKKMNNDEDGIRTHACRAQ